MDSLIHNKNFKNIREVVFDADLKSRIQAAAGDIFADKCEKRAKGVRGFIFDYISNDHLVQGLMVLPKDVSAEKRLPVIIHNRGGYKDFGLLKIGQLFQGLGVLAEQGYCVIASQYSGNSYSDGKDEYGGTDVDDILNLYPIITSIPFLDPKRIGMDGGSRGGMMAYLMLTKVSWIKAACISAGLANLFRSAELRPEMQRVYEEAFGGDDVGKEKRSVVCWPEKLPKDVPILILHGTDDKRVSVEDAHEVDKKLSEHNIPHELVIFPGDDHYFTKNKKESTKLILEWFKRHV